MKARETTRPLRVGIVGAGPMGRHHAAAIRELHQLATLVAMVDPQEEARESAARQFGIPGRATLEELLALDTPDVVHICTPPGTHVPLAMTAVDRSVHVYIEKPVADSVAAFDTLSEAARRKGVMICAGHQLLFEPPMEALRETLPALGRVVHVDSYFAFRPVRRTPDGRAPLRADLQLLDILPHPVYLLLEALALAAPEGHCDLRRLDLGPNGTLHGLFLRGGITGNLIVTLEGRPVDSYLKIVGTNGVLHADFVRGSAQRVVGPGVSGIDKALIPYRLAWQLLTGTTAALWRRARARRSGYPALARMFGAYYRAILSGSGSPTPLESLTDGVAIWEKVATLLEGLPTAQGLPAHSASEPLVIVTGGTGFLGQAVVRQLQKTGLAVRSLGRRLPAPWERVPGAEYATVDLGDAVPPDLLRGATVVVHCAAETAGGWAEHERNSIAATRNLFRAAAAAGVRRIVHVSSIAVLAPSPGPASEGTAIEPNTRSKGPYVWGKILSEEVAREEAASLGIDLRVVRPGAIVEYRSLEPPGRLGKRIGPLFVAIGPRSGRFGVIDRTVAAETLAWMVPHFDRTPPVLHLLDPAPPTRRELVRLYLQTSPGVRVIWLPRFMLRFLSGAATGLQRLLRPRRQPMVLSRIFADQDFDFRTMRVIQEEMLLPAPPWTPSLPESPREAN